jgi:pyridoxine kinase
MTVAMPILSACGHETCIMPTALLSTHTGGFGKPAVMHMDEILPQMVKHWQENDISFDAILVGYLGSLSAVCVAEQILDTMLAPGGIAIVDPAMADHGKLYRGLDEAYAEAMKRLCYRADLILPNITEAAMMTGQPFREKLDEAYVRQLLSGMEGKQVLMTGVGFSADETGFALKTDAGIVFSHHARLNRSYHGTGDLFASAFVGALASGKSEFEAARIASEFTLKSIRNTYENPAHSYGVKFETALPDLIDMLK